MANKECSSAPDVRTYTFNYFNRVYGDRHWNGGLKDYCAKKNAGLGYVCSNEYFIHDLCCVLCGCVCLLVSLDVLFNIHIMFTYIKKLNCGPIGKLWFLSSGLC